MELLIFFSVNKRGFIMISIEQKNLFLQIASSVLKNDVKLTEEQIIQFEFAFDSTFYSALKKYIIEHEAKR